MYMLYCSDNVVMTMYFYYSRPDSFHGYTVAQAPTNSTFSDFWRSKIVQKSGPIIVHRR